MDEKQKQSSADTGKGTSETGRATFGGGCFWCTEAVFLRVKGVSRVVSGYAGGKTPNPTYKQVCTGLTGHAEVIQIEYDPAVITYEQLLDIHLHTHDPTTLNRQGADTGTQYRSAIFYHDEQQKAAARKAIAKVNADQDFDDPLVTTIEKLDKFYPAEDYHQDYFAQNPGNPYCQVVVGPKVAKFQKRYKALLKPDEK
ncbi:MAG: peptide-methionine (S)-S-oxide reductase MsrA [Planctomycetaceae bacterium]|nr:peptide-methionine (S)-S-oxide reductase MsrA [Planctomycetaceae bacterium]